MSYGKRLIEAMRPLTERAQVERIERDLFYRVDPARRSFTPASLPAPVSPPAPAPPACPTLAHFEPGQRLIDKE